MSSHRSDLRGDEGMTRPLTRLGNGRLPGAYKAGRSWRIPAAALIEAGLGTALEPDKVEAKLTAAQAAVHQLLAELEDAARRNQRPVVDREWDAVATRANTLASSATRLADVANQAHQRFNA